MGSTPSKKTEPPSSAGTDGSTTVLFPTRRVLVYSSADTLSPALRRGFEAAGYWVDVCGSLPGFFDHLERHQPSLVLYRVIPSDELWRDTLTRGIGISMGSRFALAFDTPDVATVVQAMRLGAAGVFTAGDSAEAILRDVTLPPLPVPDASPLRLRSGVALVGESETLRELRALIESLKEVDSTVLITGESGTGKEIVAQAIHEHSPFKDGPFRAVNCGAIPENLLESELFGHVKGAFTDAKTDHKGIFEACDGGTLMLDEVGDMPLLLQVKLLRVLEERQITPIGSTTPVDVNVRVLASTNRDLEEMVAEGRFRRDLYFRLAVVRFRLPPLRERRQDIPLLVNLYREHFCKRFGRPMPPLSGELWTRLLAYDWPGNVRELRNVVERGVALSKDGQLQLSDLLPEAKGEKLAFPQFCPLNPANDQPASYREIKNCCEKSYLTRLLQLSEGNISEVARLAGRHRTEIYRQLQKLSLDPKKFQKP